MLTHWLTEALSSPTIECKQYAGVQNESDNLRPELDLKTPKKKLLYSTSSVIIDKLRIIIAINPLKEENTMPIDAKIQAKKMISNLPDNTTLEDIQYHLFVAEKLNKARKQIKEGKIHSQEAVEKILQKWIIE